MIRDQYFLPDYKALQCISRLEYCSKKCWFEKVLDALTAIKTRNATPRLSGSISDAALDEILRAGLRAPDHALLRPWKIIVVKGDKRNRLGTLFAEIAMTKDPDQTQEQTERLKNKALRAPIILVVAAKITEHPKVPEVEQFLSAGAVVQNMCIAAHAMGYGAIWRTGDMAYDDLVASGLGLKGNEKIVGFIYIGEVEGRQKKIPEINLEDYVVHW